MISVEGLIFDLDGTLIDSKRDLCQAVQHLQKTMQRPRSSESEVASFIGDGVVKLVQRAVPRISAKTLEEAILLFRHYYHQHCLDHTRLYPGVRKVLDHFQNRRLAVVTNKPTRVSRHILEGLGILSRFQVVLGGDAMPTRKPSPEPIRHAIQALEIASPRDVVVIGDGVNDMLAGRAAGTWTCGVLSNITRRKDLRATRPDFVVLKMHELMRIIN